LRGRAVSPHWAPFVETQHTVLTFLLTADGDHYPTTTKPINVEKTSKITRVNGVVLTGIEDGKAFFKLVGTGKKQKNSKTTITFEF